jgi:hypothetical protein
MRLVVVSLGIEHFRTDEISQLPTVPDFASVFRQEREIHWLVTSVGDMSGRRDGLTTYDSTATLEHPIFMARDVGRAPKAHLPTWRGSDVNVGAKTHKDHGTRLKI